MLLSGSFSELDEVSAFKDTLISDLFNRGVPSKEALEKIEREAKRNRKILNAYQMGMKHAKFEISTIRAAASGMGAYDSKGVRKNIPAGSKVSDRRV